MSLRRLSVVTLFLLAVSGCHEDPTVLTVAVQPSVTALALLASGGTASASSGADGVGGVGGQLQVVTSGLVSIGSPAFVPAVPAVPAQPSTFSLTPTTPLQNTPSPFSGNILIAGNVTTDTTSPIVVKTDNGDIVVSGLLQSADAAGSQADISLIATNGTVYVSGTIRTSAPDAASNGRAGGKLIIKAARVVITGVIDTHGVANTTVLGANGGNGGDVDITSTFGPIFYTSGSIFTSGGAATDTSATTLVQGGAAGFVHMTAPNEVFVFAPITADGGAVTGNGMTPTGGAGGNFTVSGSGKIDVVGSLSAMGGAATGNGPHAIGGAAGSLQISGSAACKYYGTIVMEGGTAFGTGTGGTLTGGAGATLTFNGGLTSLEMGQGAFSFAGGTGQLATGVGGGLGGIVHLQSTAGDITVGGSFSVAGGAGIGANSSGAAAGRIEMFADAQFHTVSVPSLQSGLDAFGGAAQGTGVGGVGGTVFLQSGGSLTSGARINVSGGSSVAGIGGGTTTLAAVGALPATCAVILRVATTVVNLGSLDVTGTILTQGGIVTAGGNGGNGAGIGMEIANGNGTLTSSATLTTTGGNGIVGPGGTPGVIFISNTVGDVSLSGVMTTSGATSPTNPSVAGDITIRSGGTVTSSATMTAVGGASSDGAGMISGNKGGAISVTGLTTLSSILLLPGTTMQADGGGAPGANLSTLGGAGGSITLQVLQQSISMSGSYLARGGSVSGVGTGGPGGFMTVLTNGGGAITLQPDGGLDLSGGSGTVLGSARQNGGNPFPNATAAILAVVFDADNGIGASGGTPGQVVNLGSITATGFTGGDVYFDGLDSLGGATPTPGLQNLTGPTPGNFYGN
jgi:hypothetical protein